MFLALLGLCHCMGFSLAAETGEGGLLPSYDGFSRRGARASVVAAPGLWSAGSVAVVHRLSCSVAYGILPDQGWNLCLQH